MTRIRPFALIIIVGFGLLSQSTHSSNWRTKLEEDISSPQISVLFDRRPSRSLRTNNYDHDTVVTTLPQQPSSHETNGTLPHPNLSLSSSDTVNSNHDQSKIKNVLQLAMEEVFGQSNNPVKSDRTRPVKSDRAQSYIPVKSDLSMLPSQSSVRWRCRGALACEYITPTLVIHDAVLHQVTLPPLPSPPLSSPVIYSMV